jgi:diphosphomevalonate decarboxylase
MNSKIIAQSSWQSPSNIAIVKYWGKYGNQLPINPSISFTLSKALTETTIGLYNKENEKRIDLEFFFEEKTNDIFKGKIQIFLEQILSELPYLENYKIRIDSKNTFPHSAGIASSASSMSALALCLVDLEQQLINQKLSKEAFLKRSSYFARLASGSAARSVFPYVSLWGKLNEIENSAQEYAIELQGKLHSAFLNYHDSILIIDAGEKKVSSRAGHSLMNNHPYSQARKDQAFSNIRTLIQVFESGDLEKFTQIAENEALSLHAMMLSSNPWYSLLKPGTLLALEKIKLFREETKIPLCFTLDAGPNVHILFPDAYKNQVNQFIKNELIVLSAKNQLIEDTIGSGPNKN